VKRFLLGIAAAAVGLLSAVTLQIGRRQFRQLPDIAIIALTFLAVSFLKLPLFAVLLGMGPISVWLYRPHIFKTTRGRRASAVSSRRTAPSVQALS